MRAWLRYQRSRQAGSAAEQGQLGHPRAAVLFVWLLVVRCCAVSFLCLLLGVCAGHQAAMLRALPSRVFVLLVHCSGVLAVLAASCHWSRAGLC